MLAYHVVPVVSTVPFGLEQVAEVVEVAARHNVCRRVHLGRHIEQVSLLQLLPTIEQRGKMCQLLPSLHDAVGAWVVAGQRSGQGRGWAVRTGSARHLHGWALTNDLKLQIANIVCE